jgi:hypothetical protein
MGDLQGVCGLACMPAQMHDLPRALAEDASRHDYFFVSVIIGLYFQVKISLREAIHRGKRKLLALPENTVNFHTRWDQNTCSITR